MSSEIDDLCIEARHETSIETLNRTAAEWLGDESGKCDKCGAYISLNVDHCKWCDLDCDPIRVVPKYHGRWELAGKILEAVPNNSGVLRNDLDDPPFWGAEAWHQDKMITTTASTGPLAVVQLAYVLAQLGVEPVQEDTHE